MDTIIIREIQKQDNEQIASVIRAVFISDSYPKTGTAFADSQLDFMYEAYDLPNAAYFVVIDTEINSAFYGKIIGGAGVSPLETSSDSICELQKMYFLETARGKGIGFQMIKICLDKAKSLGFEKCYLETLPEMQSAQKLYKKVGFDYICSPMGNTGHTSCPIWMLKTL
jgi:putative acetyltransferase